MTGIAGRLPLAAVMEFLSARRPVFHSEADFQFEFARAVVALDDSIDIRLEVPKRTETARTYVDLVCVGDRTSLIEFKYVTRSWQGHDGRTPEKFDLRSHEALDLARLHFIHDVTRLEGWVATDANTDGFAVFLTNDSRLWGRPSTSRVTRDQAFRLHQDRTLSGDLRWGTPEKRYPRNDRPLRGTYTADWCDYGTLDDKPGGTLRWMGWHVTS
ncbi:hypothetical protein EXE58_11760 [Nocardioides seonyuensis]|uniref:Uncharacterized protein n=1 Tax=Nocardioides seonyuensis TaxID=2518371 RepID=A0A4P7IJK9_9ACTN|nr:hypothetical protein [Nocardioides seonyuensis]QBX56071.1 hypothetical protein EXE58_11760 [Nocardioides seonyuensis]